MFLTLRLCGGLRYLGRADDVRRNRVGIRDLPYAFDAAACASEPVRGWLVSGGIHAMPSLQRDASDAGDEMFGSFDGAAPRDLAHCGHTWPILGSAHNAENAVPDGHAGMAEAVDAADLKSVLSRSSPIP